MTTLLTIKQISQKINALLLDLGALEQKNTDHEKYNSQWDPVWQIPAYIRRSQHKKQ